MRLPLPILAALFLSAIPAGSALAQEQAPACTATAQSLPPELATWNDRHPLDAATKPARARGSRIEIGQAVDAKLAPTAEVEYAVRPQQKGGSVSYGGLLSFTVKEPGTYRIALGAGAWIDVVRGGKAAESAAHGHGPECSGIRKMVDFVLSPGIYLLQIGANGSADLPVLVQRLP